MRFTAILPALLFAAILPAQTPPSSEQAAPVPAGHPGHPWTLQERSAWSLSQLPQIPLAADLWPSGPGTTLVLGVPISACPVDLRVRRLTSERSLVRTHEGRRIDNVSAHLRLSLQDPNPAQVAGEMVAARIVVHGTNGRNHMLGLHNDPDRPYHITRTLTVSLSPGDPSGVAGEVQLPGFTSTDWVELQEITMADHETWSIPERACRVQPDPLMLITER